MKLKHKNFIVVLSVLVGWLCICFSFVSKAAQTNIIFGINKSWKYNQTSNLDGANWKVPAYNDSAWPSGPGLLGVENNAAVGTMATVLTLGRTNYYFRTGFNFTGDPNAVVLTFSNKIDDGAVFYLNGTEIQRIRMSAAPAVITYTNYATSTPSSGDATNWDVFTIVGTNLVAGTNVLAVEVHQASPGSSDIVFGCALGSGPGGISRGPYLQNGSSTNVTVRWRTDTLMPDIVGYGIATNALIFMTNAGANTEHEITLTNLLPDTKYFYVIDGGAPDTNQFFLTAPVPGVAKPTRIWVLGDAGTANANQKAVRDAYYNFTGARHTDLWLMLGDNAYNQGLDSEYQAAVFNIYGAMLKKSVLWSTLGNHETAQATTFSDAYPYFSIFTFPTDGAAGGMPSGTEHYYSFDYANIHFVCLDSMTANRGTTNAMANWLRSDLGSTTNTWLIAFWHHPPYTKGSHDSDAETPLIEMRQNFLPILEEAGVDLVLSGHSHAYERSYLLDGHYSSSVNLQPSMKLNAGGGREASATGAYVKNPSAGGHQGTVYAVAGSSGQTSGGSLNHPAMFISLNNLGSMVLDIDGDRLDAKFIRETGAVDDNFTILKRDVSLSALMTNGTMTVCATNVAASKTNILQVTSDFVSWPPISTNVISSNSFNVLDNNAGGAPRFYRVLRLP